MKSLRQSIGRVYMSSLTQCEKGGFELLFHPMFGISALISMDLFRAEQVLNTIIQALKMTSVQMNASGCIK